jgi:predicted alpha/beta superfamily hydrolase
MRSFLISAFLLLAACGGPMEELDPASSAPLGQQQSAAGTQFTKGGQVAWFHDEGFSYGFFHTYDAFKVAGPNDVPRKVHIFVPRDYETSGRRYPVIYMNDGQAVFFNGGASGKSWRVGQTLSDLKARGLIRDVIVVALYPLERNREYTHVFWAPGQECCALEGYTHYVADSVKGWVDANYRTLPEATNTAIVGSSHGGLASFYMSNRRPDRFGMAGAMSSSFWAGLDVFVANGGPLSSSELIRLTQGTLANSTLRPRLWIDWGLRRTAGFHDSVIEDAATRRGQEMVDLLRNRYAYGSFHLKTHVDPLGGHDEDAWAYRFGLLMQHFFPRP